MVKLTFDAEHATQAFASQADWLDYYATFCDQRDVGAEQVDADCSALISRRQAAQFRIVPLRWDEGHLEIATTAEHLDRAMEFALTSITRAARMVLVSPLCLENLLSAIYPEH